MCLRPLKSKEGTDGKRGQTGRGAARPDKTEGGKVRPGKNGLTKRGDVVKWL